MAIQTYNSRRLLVGAILNQFIHRYDKMETVGDCSTEATIVGLGFPASAARLHNRGLVDIYFDLTGAAQGRGSAIHSGGIIEFSCDPPISFVSLWTTSTEVGGISIDVLGVGSAPIPHAASDSLGLGMLVGTETSQVTV